MSLNIYFSGRILSIQPHFRLKRYLKEISLSYVGYAIRIEGKLKNTVDGNPVDAYSIFTISINKTEHANHQFMVNDDISGACVQVPKPIRDSVDFFKVSKLTLVRQGEQGSTASPWELIPPPLEVYKARGYRWLAMKNYNMKCNSCMWAALLWVDLVKDKLNLKELRNYRTEAFCYGPLSCKHYSSGSKKILEYPKSIFLHRRIGKMFNGLCLGIQMNNKKSLADRKSVV